MQRLVTYSFHSFYSEPRHRQVYIMPATLKDTHEEEFKKKKKQGADASTHPPTFQYRREVRAQSCLHSRKSEDLKCSRKTAGEPQDN